MISEKYRKNFDIDHGFLKPINNDVKIYTQSERFLQNYAKALFFKRAAVNIQKILYLLRPIFAVRMLARYCMMKLTCSLNADDDKHKMICEQKIEMSTFNGQSSHLKKQNEEKHNVRGTGLTVYFL